MPNVGDTFSLGSATVTVLGPQKHYSDVNNQSLILRVDYGSNAFLFTGDAEYESETDVLDAGEDVRCDVIKAGHHGSRTSTGYRLLYEAQPKYAVISCGADNEYGHPHDDTLSRLRDADVTVYRTDLNGTIVCRSDGVNLTFTTEKKADPLAPHPLGGGRVLARRVHVFHRGFTFLASRIAQDYGTPFVLLFWRFALAFLLLNLLRLTGRFPVRFRSRKLWPVLLAGLFEPVLYFPCEQYGLRLTSTSFSGVMVALIPLCSLVYGAVFLHEKATWRQVVFSVLSVAGVIVLAVYATGIGARQLSRLSHPARHGLCRRGLHSGLPRLFRQLHRL
ncbi:MAG: EamA family transporter [Oscillospiraceae bacterium]